MHITGKDFKLTLLAILFFFLSIIANASSHDRSNNTPSLPAYNEKIESFCSSSFAVLRSESSKPDYAVFKKALTGFFYLKATNNIKKNILTIIDFSISSKIERMWIIDINEMKVLHSCLVAHGRNSGEEFATHFSNSPSSCQSSLGFYLTGDTYIGRHGLSLYLDGVEPGINDNARGRAIVMHGADYVSTTFVNQVGRLGRSFGCPAIPMFGHEEIIKMLSDKSCLYIYYPDEKYQNSSGMFATEMAFNGLTNFLLESPRLDNSN
jgi:L,D-transpeptidase catalytic domain